MPKTKDSLDVAVALRTEGKAELALKMLRRLIQKSPANAQLEYQAAWTCDSLGREREAVPHYEQALVLGLTGDDLRGALLGLGSTYRALGEYDKAKITFETGREFFPQAQEFAVFLAMANYNLHQHQAAMALLLHTLADTSNDTDVQRYKQAILFYADKLDEIWE